MQDNSDEANERQAVSNLVAMLVLAGVDSNAPNSVGEVPSLQ
jgi:hypothetical protein